MKGKIVKRSLALGALMAFVITGSAMAGDSTGKSLTINSWTTWDDFKTANTDWSSEDNRIYHNTSLVGNTVTVQKLSDSDSIMIGSASATSSNEPKIYLIGAKSTADNVTLKGNTIYFDAGTNGGVRAMYGVFATGTGGNAEGNIIDFKSGEAGVVFGARAANGYASGNIVNVYGGNITSSLAGGAGYGSGGATNNTVNIYDGTIADAQGGQGDKTSPANNNTVNIYGGIVTKAFGGLLTGSGKTNGNTVNISGGTVTNAYGGRTTEGEASGNIVNVSGGEVTSNIYGGYSANKYKSAVLTNNTVKISGTAGIASATLWGANKDGQSGNKLIIDANWTGNGSLSNVKYFDIIETGKALNIAKFTPNSEGTLTFKVDSMDNAITIANVVTDTDVDATFDANQKTVVVEGTGNVADEMAGLQGEALNEKIKKLASLVTIENQKIYAEEIAVEEGAVQGAITATLDENGEVSGTPTVASNKTNEALSETGAGLKAHWQRHMNDMNKRMGELRNANGEHGVWARLVRGETEYQGSKAQYNQYQLGYDEKLSVDKRWTVGAAVTFSEGDGNFAKGSTEDKSTAFAIYGSKLNNDGSFVDLIARYAHLESDIEMYTGDKGDYGTNGYSVSAEFGKRFTKDNGFWIEPQFEVTYGTVDSVDYKLSGRNVHYDRMDSFITRAGFAIGKDIKQGNVYARASYLYDFDGKADTVVTADGVAGSDPHTDDLGGGWWEVGVGANINLSKATYIYADVEKTFGGEVDTNWQWNLGVRYSF